MRLFFLISSFIFSAANFANGQTMKDVIDNLIKHQLISDADKKDVEVFLERKGETFNIVILQALMYVEMVKIVGRENMSKDSDSFVPYLKMSLLEEPGRQQQDSINRDLAGYLKNINAAGLISDSLYTEFKTNIDENRYARRMMLNYDLVEKAAFAEFISADALHQQEKTYLTNKQIEEACSNWQKAGILGHLTKDQIALAKKKALSGQYENLNEALKNFPGVIHWFDLELENLKDPYAELVKEFIKISHGVFKPTNISDNFNKPVKDKVTLKFTLNNKAYSKELRVFDDWADADFFSFIKQVVTENKLPGQFYDLYEGGQGANVIFLTPEQYQSLKTNKLVVFAEDHP